MKTAEELTMFEKMVFGWLPMRPAVSETYGATRPWWWLTIWSMGVFVAEVGVLNLIVPVSTLALPLFLANMWLCFAAGGIAGYWIGRMRGYQFSLPSGRGWGERPRWWVAIPVAAELGVGVTYFSVSNWVYVFTYCQTGNVCTLSQLAPVMLLIIGIISLVVLGFNALLVRSRNGHASADEPASVQKP
jgi:hypothetical protein